MKNKILLYIMIMLLIFHGCVFSNYVISEDISYQNDDEILCNENNMLDACESFTWNDSVSVLSNEVEDLEENKDEEQKNSEDNLRDKNLDIFDNENITTNDSKENMDLDSQDVFFQKNTLDKGPTRGMTSISWDNDNSLNSNFWSQNPSDEDIIDAIYWSEWDTTFYTLWWPSICTNMNVVHVTTNNGLPSSLSENTIYVLDTDILFLQWQTLLNNCSALISSRDLEFWTKIYSSEAVWSQWIIYSNWKNFVVIDNVSIDGYLFWNSTTAVTLSFENSKYNTLNNVSLYNSNLTSLSLASNSNYNKINNVHIYNSQKHGVSFSSNSNRNTVNNIQIYNNGRTTQSYAVYILGWSTKNVFNNALIYNNWYWVYLNQTSNNYFNNTLLYNNFKSRNAGLSNNYYYGERVSDWDVATAWSSSDFSNISRLGWQIISTQSPFFDNVTTPVDNDWVYMYPRNVMPNDVRWPKEFLDFSGYEYWTQIRVQEQPVAYNWEELVNRWNYNSNLYIWQRIEWSSQVSDFIDPVCQIEYNITWFTNQDVIATLTWCSEEILDTETSHTFTGNWQFLFVFEDLAWNTNWEWAEVNRIDKDNPQCNVEYDITGQTFWNVVATLTWCSEDILDTEIAYTFTKNGQHLFVFHDLVWNTWETLAMVDWIGSKTSNWWASSLKKDYCPNGDYSDSYYDWDCWQLENDTTESVSPQHWSAWKNSESQEYINAYIWAYNNWLLNIKQINNRKFQMELTRIEMSRLLSTYAINILWRIPDNQREFYFTDVSNYLDKLYDNGVSLSYKLWIMWINMPNGDFRPNDTVSNAEFITSLSRMLYETADWPDIYYSTHMNLMKNLWVIWNINPYNTEKFWDVLIILYRVGDIKK